MEKPKEFDQIVDDFVKVMHGKLEEQGVTVKQDLLKKVLTETEDEFDKKGAVQDCPKGCANGWHW